MERRSFLQLSAAGSVLGANAGAAAQEQAPDGKLAIGNPVVMAPRVDGVEIVWRVGGLAKGHVEYGKTEALGEFARNDGWGLKPASKQVLRVRLEGLEPGTQYFYRVVTEDFARTAPVTETEALRSFRTLSATAETTRFSIWNDTHKHNETIQKLGELTPASDFLLWNGDISNDWNEEGDVADSLLNPGGVDFTAKHPLVALRGNHDLRGTLAYEFEDYAAMPDGKPWHAFRSGPVAAICLDTGEDKADDRKELFGRVACEPMRREQAAWLAEVIERPEIKTAPFRLVFCHIPLRWTDEATVGSFDRFSKRSRDLWHASLVKWGAQMVISGHTHRDTHIEPADGFPYAQLIGGGPKMRQARLITGKANLQELVLTMTDMDGKAIREVKLGAL